MQSQQANRQVTLVVNGQERHLLVTPNTTLLEVLREKLGLTGTKHGCELGECGACTVLIDDEPVLSCLTLAVEAEGSEITTIEEVGKEELHSLQKLFAEEGATQCGYCTSGMILTAKHLIENNPDPDRDEIAEAISGNICRCTGYEKIISAIKKSAQEVS